MASNTGYISKFFLIIFIVSLSISSQANSQIWKQKGQTANKYINCIYLFGDDHQSIAVASDQLNTDLAKDEIAEVPYDGNGFQISTDGGATFGETFLDGYRVFSILQSPTDPAKWYVATRKNIRNYMAVTKDNMGEWNFSCDNSSQVMDMTFSDLNKNRILCASTMSSEGFMTTEDDFETCKDYGVNFSSRSIQVSSFDQNLLFMAGDDKRGGVWGSTDGGDTWQHSETGLKHLRVLCVMPGGYDISEIYAGCDSLTDEKSKGMGIYQSLDTGKTWKRVGAEGYRIFDIKKHPKNPQLMAAAGDSSGVWFSGSWGYSWENFSDGLPTDKPVRHIEIPNWSTASGLKVIAAVYGVGLFESDPVVTSVEDTPDYKSTSSGIEILRTYPMPFNSSMRISWNNEREQYVEVYVIDQMGRKVTTIDNRRFGSGEQLTIFNTEGLSLSTGVYMLCIKSNGKIQSRKIFFDPNK